MPGCLWKTLTSGLSSFSLVVRLEADSGPCGRDTRRMCGCGCVDVVVNPSLALILVNYTVQPLCTMWVSLNNIVGYLIVRQYVLFM